MKNKQESLAYARQLDCMDFPKDYGDYGLKISGIYPLISVIKYRNVLYFPILQEINI